MSKLDNSYFTKDIYTETTPPKYPTIYDIKPQVLSNVRLGLLAGVFILIVLNITGFFPYTDDVSSNKYTIIDLRFNFMDKIIMLLFYLFIIYIILYMSFDNYKNSHNWVIDYITYFINITDLFHSIMVINMTILFYCIMLLFNIVSVPIQIIMSFATIASVYCLCWIIEYVVNGDLKNNKSGRISAPYTSSVFSSIVNMLKFPTLVNVNDNTITKTQNNKQLVFPPEVFIVGDPIYKFQMAKTIASERDIEIATYEQLRNAFDEGADWYDVNIWTREGDLYIVRSETPVVTTTETQTEVQTNVQTDNTIQDDLVAGDSEGISGVKVAYGKYLVKLDPLDGDIRGCIALYGCKPVVSDDVRDKMKDDLLFGDLSDGDRISTELALTNPDLFLNPHPFKRGVWYSSDRNIDGKKPSKNILFCKR